MKAKLLLVLTLALSIPMLTSPTIHAVNGIPGDINGDGKVNILDVTLAAAQYTLTPEDPEYNSTVVAKADLAPPYNGILDILDLVTLVSHYTG